MTGQETFRAALFEPAQAVPDGLRDGHGGPAGRRFAVYRNNVAVALTEALESGFPTVRKLLGPQNFRGLAGLYLRAHPPASPVMMLYGGTLPAFIAKTPQLAHLGYLPDVARLDLALRESYHAADARPVAPEVLAAIPAKALEGIRLSLAPALRLLRSRWPLHAIHRFNHEPGAPKPVPRAEDVLVTRPGFDPLPRLLPPGGGAALAALRDGRTLGAALAAGTAEDPAFDPAALLTLLSQDGCITGVETQE